LWLFGTHILCAFGTFSPFFGMLQQKKSGNPALGQVQIHVKKLLYQKERGCEKARLSILFIANRRGIETEMGPASFVRFFFLLYNLQHTLTTFRM
jgi:hypothetical protein